MATFLGLDVEQAEEHAQRLRSARKVLDGSLRALETTIRSSEGFWRGPDVEAFRGRWAETRPTLRTRRTVIRTAAPSTRKWRRTGRG